MIGSFILGSLIGIVVIAVAHLFAPPARNCGCRTFFHTPTLLEIVNMVPLSLLVIFGLTTNMAQLMGFALVVAFRAFRLVPRLRTHQ